MGDAHTCPTCMLVCARGQHWTSFSFPVSLPFEREDFSLKLGLAVSLDLLAREVLGFAFLQLLSAEWQVRTTILEFCVGARDPNLAPHAFPARALLTERLCNPYFFCVDISISRAFIFPIDLTVPLTPVIRVFL